MFGGDALLRKNLLLEMISFCKEHDIDTYFPTNSNLLDEKMIINLLAAGIGTIYFSLDEIPSMDFSVRGVKNHFLKVKEAITLTLKHRGMKQRPRVVCITTVSKYNHTYLADFVDFAANIGIDELILRGLSNFPMASVNASKVHGISPEPYFMSTDDGSVYLTHGEAKALLSTLRELKRQRKRKRILHVDTKNMDQLSAELLMAWRYAKIKCVRNSINAILTPGGDVIPCPYYNNYILGNLKNSDLSTIWGNEKHRYFCNMQKKGRLDLCNYCSVKFYHKAFWASVQEVVQKARDKVFMA
jgi:MoaA/NifB/PqqE/SkfB family radical SAM enzyme